MENFNLSNSYRFLLNHYKGKRFRANLHLLLCQSSSVGLLYLQQRQRYIQKLIFHSYFQTGKWTQAYNRKKALRIYKKKRDLLLIKQCNKSRNTGRKWNIKKITSVEVCLSIRSFFSWLYNYYHHLSNPICPKTKQTKKLLDWFCTQALWPCRQKHCAIWII